jgi:hypothetical protein
MLLRIAPSDATSLIQTVWEIEKMVIEALENILSP